MKTHIRYYFENFIARKSNFVYFLMIVSAVFALLMIAVEMSLGLIENDSFFNIWWSRLERLLEIEESGAEFKERFVTLVYWIFSVAFSGTIIAFLAAKVSSFIEDLKKGHSYVIDTNHYVIVGWNSTVFKIFDEIEAANENQSKPTVLCFNGLDNLEMNNRINTERPYQKNIRIITRSGNIYSIQDLARTNMNNSKSVIILDDATHQNYNIETTILAVKQNLNNQNIPIIAQFSSGENVDIISKLMGNQVYPILKDNIISSVTAQSIRNKHISSVVLDFIDYDGDELYFFPSDGLAKKTFKQAMLMLQEVTLVGIRTADGQVLLNPKKDYIILEDDHLIVIAEDDNLEIKLKSVTEIDHFLDKIKISETSTNKKETISVLVLGWSQLGQQIVDSTIPFLSDESSFCFAFREDLVFKNPVIAKNNSIKPSIILLKKDNNDTIRDLIAEKHFDIILNLGYDDKLSNEVSDTNSLMQIFYVKSILEELKKSNTCRIILQLNDGSKKDLIQELNKNEVIVSDVLSSLMITQLADNPKLWFVFEKLFKESGLKISSKSIAEYGVKSINKQFSIYDLIVLSIKDNQTFMGYILNDKLQLNPSKSEIIQGNDSLSIVYIG